MDELTLILSKIDWKKVGIGAAILTTVIFIIVIILKTKNKISDTITEVQEEHINSLEVKKDDITLTNAQLQSLVKKLKSSFGRWGWATDEDGIYSVYEALNTRSDVLKLVNTFGVQDGHTLNEWLYKELNAKELEHLQSILTSKGIVFTI